MTEYREPLPLTTEQEANVEALFTDLAERAAAFNEPVCGHCQQDAKHCGVLVSYDGGRTYTGAAHLPRVGQRRGLSHPSGRVSA
jgi:hypothetical protein